MKKFCIAMMALLAFTTSASAQVLEPQETPQLEFALQLKVTLGEAFSCGETQHGRRTVIPITGGTFEGPNIKGTIINGGADYQLANTSINRTELEAIYCIKTDDGAAPQFEAPADSKYAWLNNSLFVCAPMFSQEFKGIVLNVWRVK